MTLEIDIDAIKKHLGKRELKDAIRVQSNIRSNLSEFFKNKRYLKIPPVIISPLTDPLNYPALDSYINYYGRPYILTKSMIFHKQIADDHLTKELIYKIDINDNMDKEDKKKVKVELDRDIVEELLEMKHVGDSYSNIIRKLLEGKVELDQDVVERLWDMLHLGDSYSDIIRKLLDEHEKTIVKANKNEE